MELKDFINYIDSAIDDRDHTCSSWIDERGIEHPTDVGYVFDWWEEIKEELNRVFNVKLEMENKI